MDVIRMSKVSRKAKAIKIVWAVQECHEVRNQSSAHLGRFGV